MKEIKEGALHIFLIAQAPYRHSLHMKTFMAKANVEQQLKSPSSSLAHAPLNRNVFLYEGKKNEVF